MSKPLHALLVEDSEDDALLLLDALRRGGFAVTYERVQTAEAMKEALARRTWEIVLSDYSMPTFDALAALAVLQRTGIDIPFMVISGTIGEESAVNALKAGANDFLVKGRLARLVPAVERELRESKAREARRRAEVALRESETRFKRLFDSGMIGIVIADASGRLLEANDAFLGMVGYDRKDLAAGRITWDNLTPPEWSKASAKSSGQLRAVGVSRPWEQEYLRKGGGRVPVLAGVATLEGTSAISFCVDLRHQKSTEEALKKSEEQFRQVQKMEAIGRLAGGVAHDFNNLLSVVLSYSEMLIAELPPEEAMRADIEEIQAAGRRATDLTRQLLAFSRQQMLEPKVLDLNEVVQNSEKMLRRLIGEDIEFTVIPGARLGKVEVDPGQIEQVIMNLVVNARDAMPEGGKLTIETASIRLDEEYTREHVGVEPGPYVMLAVTDSGVGIDRATQARIFEPFFTTKERGKGTGLGLSTVFGIVAQSGGHIWVYSEIGEGTTFKVYFPRSAQVASHTLVPAAETKTLRGDETVLLVEDEAAVRVVTSAILRRQGYHVVEAQSGGDALLICEQHQAAIHLLLTDVVMPRMSGRQLAERLSALRPDMKVLYMSGYTQNSIVLHGVVDSGISFIQKPITPAALVRKVRMILDTPKGVAG